MKFCHLIWFTEVLEWNHLGRYQLNGLFPLRDGSWKWNAYIFLTDFFWISLQGQWVSRCGGLHFLSTIQNTSYKISPGHSHVAFTVFTLLFQCLYWKSCSCCSLSCVGLLPPQSKYSLDSPLVSDAFPALVCGQLYLGSCLALQYQFREVSGFCGKVWACFLHHYLQLSASSRGFAATAFRLQPFNSQPAFLMLLLLSVASCCYLGLVEGESQAKHFCLFSLLSLAS